jgi:hypothetical protein
MAAVLKAWNVTLCKRRGPDGQWWTRHCDALRLPARWEHEIVTLARSLASYADAHAARYESPIGSDGVLGRDWERMLKGLRGLLNGETGRLDCGTVDAAILAMYAAAGFEGEL